MGREMCDEIFALSAYQRLMKSSEQSSFCQNEMTSKIYDVWSKKSNFPVGKLSNYKTTENTNWCKKMDLYTPFVPDFKRMYLSEFLR